VFVEVTIVICVICNVTDAVNVYENLACLIFTGQNSSGRSGEMDVQCPARSQKPLSLFCGTWCI